MRLLPRPEALGSIDDVELFCRDAMRRGLAACRGRLQGDDREEALQHLIKELYELWDDYDPALNSSFTKYAWEFLPKRLVDWYRKRLGDSRYAPRPKVTSLGDFREELGHIVDHSSSLEEVLTRVAFAR